MKIEVLLVACAPNVTSPAYSAVLCCDTPEGLAFPRRELDENCSSLETAAKMLEDSLGLQARIFGHGWVDLLPLPVADHALRVRDGIRWIGLAYSCIIPQRVKPKQDAKWVELAEIVVSRMVEDHLDILHTSCQRS